MYVQQQIPTSPIRSLPFGGQSTDYGKNQAYRTCAAADRTA